MARSIIRRVARAGRNFEPTWRYGFNLRPTVAYKLHRHPLPSQACRVLADLGRDGVAITSGQELLGSESGFEELGETVERLEDSLARELAGTRLSANDTSAVGKKTFTFELLGERPVLDPGSIYARVALQYPILQIANAYFGMLTRLRYYNVWHTFAATAEARESQLWHRDREDFHILKMFVYLSDVSDAAGPLTYATGSHGRRSLQREPAFFVEGGTRRSTDVQMAEVVPSDRWTTCTGPQGTVVFADTSGYHKGGLAREHDRIVYTCMFTSVASQSHELLRRPPDLPLPLDRERAFALR
jgi:hypothetical protein